MLAVDILGTVRIKDGHILNGRTGRQSLFLIIAHVYRQWVDRRPSFLEFVVIILQVGILRL